MIDATEAGESVVLTDPVTPQCICDDALEEGQAIAVRSEGQYECDDTDNRCVLAGRLANVRRGEFGSAVDGPDASPSLTIDPSRVWFFEGSDPSTVESKTISADEQDYGPPIDVQRGERTDYNPLPGVVTDRECVSADCLETRIGDTVSLIIPSPVYNSRHLLYYAPDPYGCVTRVETGAMVDPERLLPQN